MQYNNPYAWLLLIIALLTAVLMPLIWPRRRSPGVTPILLILCGATIWSLAYGIQLFNTQMDALQLWTKVVYIGVVTVSPALFLFAVKYTAADQGMPWRWVYLVLIEPVIVLLLTWTNAFHHLMQRTVGLVVINGFIYLVPIERGPVFWLHIVYNYLLLAVAAFLLVRALIRFPQTYRGQVGTLLVAAFAPWVGNIIHLAFPVLPVDPTPISFALTGLVLAYGIIHFRLFNIIPVARDQVLESLADAVLVLDDTARIVDANPAAHKLLALMETGEMIGQPGERIFEPWIGRISPFFSAETSRGEVNLGTESLPHWFDLRVSAIYSRPGGPLSGRVMVFRDIQEQKQMEEAMTEARDQALQASLMKSQLIANVSHDLRTPLNAILGFGEMLLAENFDALRPHQAQVVAQMYNSAQQMSLFVSDLLDQSMIENGKLALFPIRFRPTELVSGINGIMGRVAVEKGLLLTFEVEPDLPDYLWGDVRRLQQILMNLVSNAIKFTPRGGVTVRIYRSGPETWVLEVSDTGPGIPAEAHSYIFEPFRQVEGAPVRRQGGSGLGLAIVKHLVTMMDGHIAVESQLGRGSTFRVTLPLSREKEPAV